MWDFDSLKEAEDEAAGEAPLVFNFFDGAACVRIRKELHPEENRPEDTSNIVWPAAVVLARHLERESWECQQGAVGARPRGTGDSPEGRDVIELGAGTGLVGLAALAFGARCVVLTDVPAVLPTLQHNTELNDNAGHGTLDVMELDFRKVADEGLPKFHCAATREITRFDLVLCSDCVLWPELTEPLLVTLDQLLDLDNAALLAVAQRNSQADIFLDLLKDRFQVESLLSPPLAAEAELQAGVPIRICRVQRKPNTVSAPVYQNSRLDVSLSSRGGGSTVKTEPLSRMSVESAHAMVDELISHYSTEAFQSKLYKAWDPVKHDPREGQLARRKVLLEIQAPVMQRYGFDASMEGVINCLSQFYFPPLMYDLPLQNKIQYMMLQTKPWFQQGLRLQARIDIWRGGRRVCRLVMNLAQKVGELKMEIETQIGTPWLQQRLMADWVEIQDYWILELFVPRDRSDSVDLNLEERTPETVSWLQRLLEAPDLDSQVKHLERVPPEVLGSFEFMNTACQHCAAAIKYADTSLRADRGIMCAAVSHSGLALQYASSELRADADLVFEAICGKTGSSSGMALQFAAEHLRADRLLVVQAITKDAWAIQFASEELQMDKEIILLVVRKNGLVLPELPPRIQTDRDVVLAAVEQNGRVLQSVKQWFRSDRDVVLAAVRQYPLALEFASAKSKADKEIVLTAVRGDGDAFRYAHPDLQADRAVALAAVTSTGCMISLVPKALHDEELALAAVRQNVMAIGFMDEDLQAKVKGMLGLDGRFC